MRVLVTGATGFIGANLVRLLLERGNEVRILCRPSSSFLALQGIRVEKHVGDLLDRTSLSEAVMGCDHIYHLAGTYETGPGAHQRMLLTHVVGTRLLCELALERQLKMVVCSSSITLPYGSKAAPAREDDQDSFELEGVSYRAELRAYYEAKRAQERVVKTHVERGLHAVLVHPDFVLGPYDVKPTSGAIILQMARTPWIPFYPPGGKSFIGARNCAEGHILALERGKPGRSYLLGDHNYSFQEVMSLIARVVGRPPPAWPLPRFFRTSSARLDHYFGKHIEGVAQLAAYLDSLYLERYRSAERARTELGLSSEPLESAIEAAYRWFVEQGRVTC